MHILHTIDSAGIYGAETVLLNLASEQQRRGLTPTILSIGNPVCGTKALETEADRRRLRCIPYRMRDGLNLSGAREMLQIAVREQVDLIHSHGYKTNILLAATPRSGRRLPVMSTLHGWTAKSPWSKLGLYRFIDQRLLHRLDAVVVVDAKLTSIPAIAALGKERVHTIANGISLDASAPVVPAADALSRELAQLRKHYRIVLGAVGRLSPEKNFVALVDAMRQVAAAGSDVAVVILGEGPEDVALRDAIASTGLSERVRLAGYVKDARAHLPAFDGLVIPSLTEGLPMILLEAMAANLPVIATRVGDIASTLDDLGILVEPGDTRQLAAAIAAMAAEPARLKAAAAGGRKRVLQHYSSGAMAERYERVYDSVLRRFAGDAPRAAASD